MTPAKSLLRFALPFALAVGLAGCKEQPIDGAEGAIVNPLGKKSVSTPLEQNTIDNRARPGVRIEDVKSIDASKPSVEIVAPDMIQGDKLRPDRVTAPPD